MIGAPYFVRTVSTLDGRVEQGILAAEDDRSITLKVENAVLKRFNKADLDGPVKVAEKSLMPEGITAGMTPADFRDLVRYAMANPFVTDVTVNGAPVAAPVTGRIPLPAAAGEVTLEAKVSAPAAGKTQLLVGSAGPFAVRLDGAAVGSGRGTGAAAEPDREAVAVTLPAGDHTLTLVVQSPGGGAVYARLLDPDRQFRLAEPARK